MKYSLFISPFIKHLHSIHSEYIWKIILGVAWVVMCVLFYTFKEEDIRYQGQ